MPDRTDCPTCGARIDRPAGFARAKIRCPGCGYYADTPADWAAPPAGTGDTAEAAPATVRATPAAPGPPVVTAKPAPARRRADPRDTRPDFTADAPGGAPLLAGTQTEDDDQPFAVPGTNTKPCPDCREELPLAATFCVHCGRDLASRSKTKRVHQPIDATWEEGAAFHTRLSIFAGLQVANAVFSLILYLNTTGPFTAGDFVTQVGAQGLHVALQAFLVGSYDTLTLKRTAKGTATLARRRRIAFVPFAPEKLDWKAAAGVGVVATHEIGMSSWMVFLYLLAMGVLPGLAFYWFAMRPEKHAVHLADEYGGTVDVVYRGTSHDAATDVAKLVVEATGLQYRSVM